MHNNKNYDTQELTQVLNQQLNISYANQLLQLKYMNKAELSSTKFDTNYEDDLQLLLILMKKRQSISLCNEFMKWKHLTHHKK